MAARGRVKTMVPRARSTLDGHSEVKQRRATQFSCFFRSQFSSFANYDQNTGPSKISPVRRVEPRISPRVLIKRQLRVTVSSKRMESSDFTSILAR